MNIRALVIVLAGLLVASPAASQPSGATPTTGTPWDAAEKAQSYQATQYYKAALDDFNRKRFEPALEKFRQSYGVVKSPNTRLMIVRALAALERHVEAFHEALALVTEAEEAAAKSDKYADVVTAAQVEIDALTPKLALVTVNVVAPPEAGVTLDGQPLPSDRWGVPFPVEPGPITVVLTTADGDVTASAEAQIGKHVALDLAPEAAPAAPAPRPPPAPVVEEGGYDGPDRKILALAAGSLGIVGMVNFGIFGMLSNGQLERLEIGCDSDDCAPELEDEADKGRTYQTVANVSLGIGAAFLAAGAGLLLWDIFDQEEGGESARLRVGPGSLSLGGSF